MERRPAAPGPYRATELVSTGRGAAGRALELRPACGPYGPLSWLRGGDAALLGVPLREDGTLGFVCSIAAVGRAL